MFKIYFLWEDVCNFNDRINIHLNINAFRWSLFTFLSNYCYFITTKKTCILSFFNYFCA